MRNVRKKIRVALFSAAIAAAIYARLLIDLANGRQTR